MAVLIAKRIYQGEIVELTNSEMSMNDAKSKLGEIAQFPGVLSTHQNDAEGELWIEIEGNNGDTLSDPVCFGPNEAVQALVRTGMLETEACYYMSESFAQTWLDSYYAEAGRTPPVSA